MATATFDSALIGNTGATTPAPSATQLDAAKSPAKSGGFFARFVEAREKEARRRVAYHLGSYSDVQLASLGLGARDIELLRRSGSINPELAG